MQFLAPLFLAGAAAVALPLVFHLVRQKSRKVMPFSAMMFLSPSVLQVRRRSRLEHLALLFLRCLAVCLLALAFARPFFSRPPALLPPAAASGKRIALLLDVSASMRGARWNEALAAARRWIAAANPGDELAVYTFDRAARPLLSFEEWRRTAAPERRAMALARLASASPGWAGTRTGRALVTAADALGERQADEAERRAAQLVLIGDVQRGGGFDEIEGYHWPENVQVVVERVGRPGPFANASVQPVPDTMRVRVSNARDSGKRDFRLETPDGQRDLRVAPGESETLALTAAGRAVLSGDDFDFDNSVYVAPSVPQVIHVSCVGAGEPSAPGDALFFLKRAWQPMPGYRVEFGDGPPTDFVVIFNRAPEPGTLRKFIAGGGSALLVMSDPAAGETLSGLTTGSLVRVEEASGNDALLGEIDYHDPVFAPFADPRFSDFTKIHFWKHRRVPLEGMPGARALARFDNGDAALFRVPVERGNLLVLTAGWRRDESQLALSSKFTPLLHSLLESCGVVRNRAQQYSVGDAAPVEPGSTVRLPDGHAVTLPPNAAIFSQTDQPGIYSAGEFSFAVNVDGRESDLTPVTDAELAALGLPLSAKQNAPADDARKRAAGEQNLEQSQKLWRWLVLATLAVITLETLWAALASRPQKEATA